MLKLTALVIGNGNYHHSAVLRNPPNDAIDITNRLKACGFEVNCLVDATHLEMHQAVNAFHAALIDQDVGLFFFAGHGVQVRGENILAATDTRVENEIVAKHSALPLNLVIELMEDAGTRTNIIILDACRVNPWERLWRRATPMGMAPVYAPKGTLIAFSTSPGQVASDGDGRNGAYTSALLQHIAEPEVPVETMFKRVRNSLAVATLGEQTSWEHTSLSGDFFFRVSISSQVKEYGSTAINDRLFVADPARLTHRIIRGLRIATWGTQNTALGEFDAEICNTENGDSLFVLGRNIYQAACGGSHAAEYFIPAFMERTAGVDPERRKAMLDGMLFEIFFGPDGQLRDYPKTRAFNEVFDLQAFEELKPSFDFIAASLMPAAGRFYAVPGTGRGVAAAIGVQTGAANSIFAIYVDGEDILRVAEDMTVRRNWASEFSEQELIQELSIQMLVPRRLLNVTIVPPAIPDQRLQFPRGRIVRKPI